MNPWPALFLLSAALPAATPRAMIRTATLLIGPGREPRPGDPPFRPSLEALIDLENLPEGSVPSFRLWRTQGPQPPDHKEGPLRRIAAESIAREGRSFLIRATLPEGGPHGGWLVVEVRIPGRPRLRVQAPIEVHALPAPRPRGEQGRE